MYSNNLEIYICIIVNTKIEENENYSKGLAHFVEHILYRRFLKVLDKTKCKIYAETNNLYTYYTIKGDKINIDLLFDNIDIILNPCYITKNEIEEEKQIILNEKRKKKKCIMYFQQ